jgi:hypothetical protein
MRKIAVAFPAVAVKGLCAHHHGFHRGLVTAHTVRLDDALGFFTGANGNRNVSGCECIHILRPLAALF